MIRVLQQPLLTRTLGYVLLTMALASAWVTTQIVIEYHNPVLFGDQWVIVQDLQSANGAITGHYLWVQHNEHRIPIGRLAGYADLLLFGGRNTSLVVLIFLVQLVHLGILLAVLRKSGPAELRFEIPAAALCLYCLFSPLQIENLAWGFQVCFVLVLCAASLAFAFAVTYTPPFIGLILAAWVAELSLSNGVLVWPVLSLVAFGMNYPRKKQIWLAAIGTLSFGIYFVGYRTPPYHSNPIESLRHPVAVLRFVVTYFRFTLDPAPPSASLWPTVTESMTLIALVIVLVNAWRCFVLRRTGFSRLESFCYAQQLFLLASAFVTALGRLRFGLEQAMASRYQCIALLFWACAGILILSQAAKMQNSPVLLGCEALFLVVLLAQPARFSAAEDFARSRKHISEKAYRALVQNTNDRDAIRADFPSVEAVTAWYGYLRAHQLGPDPREFGGTLAAPGLATVYPAKDALRLNGYELAPAEACWGFLDEGIAVEGSPHTFTITGWAWQRTGGKLPEKVVLAFRDGAIAQTAALGVARPDVPKAVPEISSPNTGWKATIQAGSGVRVRAYAILAGQKTACALTNEFVAP